MGSPYLGELQYLFYTILNFRNKVHTYPLNLEFPAEVMAPVDCLRTTSAQGSKHGGILEEKKHHAFDRFRSTAATTVVEARIYCQ